jgi:predicted metal-dependent HD superfamily phosphohydrolase
MEFEALKKHVLGQLEEKLDKDLTYHCLDHTLDVLDSAVRIANWEGLNGHDLCLVKSAALFHDIGFLETYNDHESASIKKAREILPKFGCTEDDMKKIEGMINSTRLPQTANNILEKIMADADLDYLGRDDFFLIGQRLQYEWKMLGKITTLREFHEIQYGFLKNHEYFTESAKKMRENKKQENIKDIEDLLSIK